MMPSDEDYHVPLGVAAFVRAFLRVHVDSSMPSNANPSVASLSQSNYKTVNNTKLTQLLLIITYREFESANAVRNVFKSSPPPFSS